MEKEQPLEEFVNKAIKDEQEESFRKDIEDLQAKCKHLFFGSPLGIDVLRYILDNLKFGHPCKAQTDIEAWLFIEDYNIAVWLMQQCGSVPEVMQILGHGAVIPK